jgi:hypothetical protein
MALGGFINMIDIKHFWLSSASRNMIEERDKGRSIYAYRVSSVPAKKHCNLGIKAVKKVLSPIPALKSNNLPSSCSTVTKNFEYSKIHFHMQISTENTNENNFTRFRFLNKHYMRLQRSPRSNSIQNDGNEKLNSRKVNLTKKCEISLQTCN